MYWIVNLAMKLTAAANLSALAVDEAAIRQARIEQNEAIASGDAERAACYWTEDVTLRRGLGDLVLGKEAYQALLTPVSLLYVRTPESVEASAHWPLAFEEGSWTARRAPDGPVAISGRYAAQWVKRDGRWLIRSEVFVALDCGEDPCPWPAAP